MKSNDLKRWVVLVAEVVTNKSRGPKGFKRFKPYPYSSSSKEHEIVYAKLFSATEDRAKEEAQKISEEMFSLFAFSLGNTEHYCVSEYTVLLHNSTDDKSEVIDSTDETCKEENKMFSKVRGRRNYIKPICNNDNLVSWGIIPYNPATNTFKILITKQRKIK